MSNTKFGIYGGQYVPEILMSEIINLEKSYNKYKDDPKFTSELEFLLNSYAGRPSMLYFAKKMTELSGKNYSQSLLSHKLANESLKYTEMKMICKILGYRIYIDIDQIQLGR